MLLFFFSAKKKRSVTPCEIGWLLWRWRRHARQHSAPATALERLAQYSQGRLNAIAARHELDFESSAGRLVLLRSEPEHAALQPALQLLRDAGVAAHEIDADAARKIEPGLSPEAPLAAAIHLPGAGAGNCRLFAQLLRQGMQGSGVHFAFGTRVDRVSSSPTGVAVQGDAEASARHRDLATSLAHRFAPAWVRFTQKE